MAMSASGLIHSFDAISCSFWCPFFYASTRSSWLETCYASYRLAKTACANSESGNGSDGAPDFGARRQYLTRPAGFASARFGLWVLAGRRAELRFGRGVFEFVAFGLGCQRQWINGPRAVSRSYGISTEMLSAIRRGSGERHRNRR